MYVKDFIDRLLMVCTEETLYVMGGWGQKLTDGAKKQLISAQKYNQSSTRKKMIESASNDTRSFDCSGLIKSVLWGYTGDDTPTGGAKYASGGVPDLNAAGLIGKCYGVSEDFTIIQEGELVYMSGHVGVYLGDGYVVECSPKWKNGVQRTELKQRKWLKHGFLPYVEYAGTSNKVHVVPGPTLRRGCKSMKVSQLQDCLHSIGYNLQIDGSYGPKTQGIVRLFQKDHDLQVDGIYGPKTYATLKEVMKA